MLGYLKRGEAYRRRQELDSGVRDLVAAAELRPGRDSAMRDLRRAAELDPLAPRPLELWATSTTRSAVRPGRRALPGLHQARRPRPRASSTSSRSRITAPGASAARSTRCSGRSRSTTGSPRRTTCSASASATRSSPTTRCARWRRRCASRPRMLHAREELADLYGRLGRTDERHRAARSAAPARSGSVAAGRARPCLRAAGQFDRRVTTLGHAAEGIPITRTPTSRSAASGSRRRSRARTAWT